jgi:hypothetical protein
MEQRVRSGCFTWQLIAVGTLGNERPPRRTLRAAFPYTALTPVFDGETLLKARDED